MILYPVQGRKLAANTANPIHPSPTRVFTPNPAPRKNRIAMTMRMTDTFPMGGEFT